MLFYIFMKQKTKKKKVSTYIPDENDSVRSYKTSFVHLQSVVVGQSSRSQKT